MIRVEYTEEIRRAAGAGEVVPMVLDLSSLRSTRRFAEEVRASVPALDALILNAGIMAPEFGLCEDGLELQMATNHMSHCLLTKELLSLVEAAAAARGPATITVVTIAAHFNSYPEGLRLDLASLKDPSIYNRMDAYVQSKLANVLFAQELATRLESSNVLVNAIHPGMVTTNLSHSLLPWVRTHIGDALVDFVKSKSELAGWHPADAALTQLYTAVSPNLKASRTTGKYFHPIARETKPDPHTFNATLQRGLCELSEAFLLAH
ncbi:hypothetical protein T492DRAFT_856959 [Pavlovales sp. CCMP2436]|nr:hypothetical protein T492DRAFT_856959 [Pavlovales sp. CCMP2436]